MECVPVPILLDEIDAIAENGLPPLVEIEEDMGDQSANIRSIEQRIAKLASSHSVDTLAARTQDVATAVARIETGLQWQEKFLKYAVSIAGIWLAFVSVGLFSARERLAALEGKGGSYQATVKSLQESSTPQEATANLDLLSGQIAKQAVSKTPPTEAELMQIGTAVSDVTKKYPELPAVWQTSGKLISYRFETNAQTPSPLKNCLGRDLPEYPQIVPDPDAYVEFFKDCTLVIDDQQAYEDDPGIKKFIAQRAMHPTVTSTELHLLRVHVVYRGGNLIPVAAFLFKDCTFEFALPTAPPDVGKKLIRELLTANPGQPVTISAAG